MAVEPEAAAAPPRPVFVEHVIANGTPIDPGHSGALGRGSADVEFRYTAIDLSASEKTRFRYRLVAYDVAWIEAGSRRNAFYTHVPPGTYQFEMLAANADGVWSTVPARVSIVVAPLSHTLRLMDW